MTFNTIKLALSLCLFLAFNVLFSQNATIINLSTPDNGSKTYKAQTEVNLLPGYEFTTSSGNMSAYIERNFSYSPTFTASTFTNSTINTSLKVGATGGSHDVSGSGGGIYTIPILIPSGTKGVAPQLALTYNSQAGNGVVGMGWNISGLSAITLSGNNWYFENSTDEVKLDGTDKFNLDGQRLLSITGTYGANNTVYGTENENYTRITSYGSGKTPDWFQVEMKDGTILEYGRNLDAKMIANNGVTYSWYLNKTMDTYGNYIAYYYINDNNDFRVDRILYTGNQTTGTLPYHTIKFNYVGRTDNNTSYFKGNTINSSTILTQIDIYAESDLFKSYKLDYGFNKVSYLNSVTEYGASNDKLNATIFKYGDKGLEFENTPCNLSLSLNPYIDYSSGADYNGDGKDDLLAVYYTYPDKNTDPSGAKRPYQWEVYVSLGNNQFSYYAKGNIPSGYYIPDDNFYNANPDKQLIPGANIPFDYYGDGASDLLLYALDGSSDGFTIKDIQILNIKGKDNVISKPIDPSFNLGGYVDPKNFLQIGDFNGDGKHDILLLKYASSKDYTYWGNLINYDEGVRFVDIGNLKYLHSSKSVVTSDFDGDGKSDLLVNYYIGDKQTIEIFEIEKISGSYKASWINYTSFSSKLINLYTGDFNGDGKTDMLTSFSEGNWQIRLSDGFNFTQQTFQFNTKPKLDYSEKSLKLDPTLSYNENITVVDIDGDGKSEIVHSYGSNMDVYSSLNSIFTFKKYTINNTYRFDYAIGDFNGDGKKEFFNRYYVNSPASIYYFNRDGKDHLLSSIKDGYNRTVNFNYTWLSKRDNYSDDGINYQTNNEKGFALPVILNTQIIDANSQISSISYAYKKATINRTGRGFLGFQSVKVTNNVTGMSTEQLYSINTESTLNGFFIMQPKSTIVSLNGAILNRSTPQNGLTRIFNTKRYTLRTLSQKNEDLFNGITSTTTLEYDNSGNVTKSTSSNGVETATTTNTYIPLSSKEFASLLSKTTSSNTRKTDTYTRSKSYTYNSKGAPLTETADPDLSKLVTTTYQYDDFGNVVQTTISSPSLPSATNKIQFDTKGRFSIATTNTLNQTSTIEYDKKWGKPTKVTDIFGKITTYTYNNFGELLTSTDPLGNVTTINRVWDITKGGTAITNPQSTVFYVHTTKTNSPYQKTWYDQYGREVKTETINGGGAVLKVTKYDVKGNVLSVTDPFYTGATPIVTTNSYDVYNRPTSISNGTVTTSYTYATSNGQLSTTISNPSQTVTQVKDASGKVISSTDNGGTLLFDYYANGQVKTTSMGSTVLTTNKYDDYGRQIELKDVDAGVTQYEYNAYGQLVSQTDALGKKTTLSYDAFGREIQKIAPEGTTSTIYVSSGNGLNQAKRITGFNGEYVDFVYDAFGRVVTETRSIDLIAYNTNYEYDAQGNVTSMKYPSGYKVKMSYSNLGELTQVTNEQGTVVVFTSPKVNQRGQYTSYILGDTKTTSFTYDAFGSLKTIAAPGVQNYEVNIDPKTGNVLYRKDYLKKRIENFSYDNVNRLTNQKVSDYSIFNPPAIDIATIEYAANGNITKKADVGAYTYDNSKIHAVTNVQNTANTIPLMQQDIKYDYDRTIEIKEGTNRLAFKYGPDLHRIKTELYQNDVKVKTKYFLGGYEKEITPTGIREVHYIPTGNGSSAVYVLDKGVANYYYLYKDHLGSVTTVTNKAGMVVYEQNFDAWGKQRNPITWDNKTFTKNAAFSWVGGFTGHEMLDEFGLVNMNNRMYDPTLGRMLAPDNLVQNPMFTQNYNRYSYVYNNPLRYTDPTGECVQYVIGAILGGYSGYKLAEANGITGWKMAGYILGGAVIGAVSGGIASEVAGAGGILANTTALVFSSSFYSAGMVALGLGLQNKSELNVNFGVASYTMDKGWSYYNKSGNSWSENLGFILGSFGTVSDFVNFADHFIDLETKLNAKCMKLQNQWNKENPNAVVASESLGRNGGRSYPSYFGKNPYYFDVEGNINYYLGKIDNWSYKEYAGYLHDMEYVSKGIGKGAKYIFSYKTYGADIRLMARTLYIGFKHLTPLEIGYGSSLIISNSIKSTFGYLIK